MFYRAIKVHYLHSCPRVILEHMPDPLTPGFVKAGRPKASLSLPMRLASVDASLDQQVEGHVPYSRLDNEYADGFPCQALTCGDLLK